LESKRKREPDGLLSLDQTEISITSYDSNPGVILYNKGLLSAPYLSMSKRMRKDENHQKQAENSDEDHQAKKGEFEEIVSEKESEELRDLFNQGSNNINPFAYNFNDPSFGDLGKNGDNHWVYPLFGATSSLQFGALSKGNLLNFVNTRRMEHSRKGKTPKKFNPIADGMGLVGN